MFMAVHCYMLSVKILASLSRLLLSHVLNADACGREQGMTMEWRWSDSTSSDMGNVEGHPSFHPNLRIGDLVSHRSQFMCALSSACATLKVSLRLLSETEVALDTAQEHSVAAILRQSCVRDFPMSNLSLIVHVRSIG